MGRRHRLVQFSRLKVPRLENFAVCRLVRHVKVLDEVISCNNESFGIFKVEGSAYEGFCTYIPSVVDDYVWSEHRPHLTGPGVRTVDLLRILTCGSTAANVPLQMPLTSFRLGQTR